MKIVFMGSPHPAVHVLEALVLSEHRVVGVYTQPDKASGRGLKLEPPPVKERALALGLLVFQPNSLRPKDVQEHLASLEPDVIVVAAYGKFLPPQLLTLPPLGCLNLHPSLLPRHRGPSPVAFSLLEGDTVTGITIILLDEGMDTGPILAQKEVSIDGEDTAESLTERLFQVGAALLLETLPRWVAQGITPQSQDQSLATVTRKLSREDGRIDWQLPAEEIWRMGRAYHPWPGIYTFWKGKLLKIRESAPDGYSGLESPGTVVADNARELGVVTGDGALRIRRLQMEGRKATTGGEFLKGYPDFVGSRLSS